MAHGKADIHKNFAIKSIQGFIKSIPIVESYLKNVPLVQLPSKGESKYISLIHLLPKDDQCTSSLFISH